MSIGTGKRLLLVEGQDDKHVIKHLQEISVPGIRFDVLEAGSWSELLKEIGPRIKAPGSERIGFVLDADESASSRWELVRAELVVAGYKPPKNLCKSGAVLCGKPTVGVWVMPDNNAPGELEDFVIKMVPDNEPVWRLARDYVDGISDADRRFAEGKIDKARLYAWLATRKEPSRMGAAIGANELNLDVELNIRFVGWLTELFK